MYLKYFFQIICDHRFRFTNVVAIWLGSVHDSRIFNNNNICTEFENGKITDIKRVITVNSDFTFKPLCIRLFSNEREKQGAFFTAKNIQDDLVLVGWLFNVPSTAR